VAEAVALSRKALMIMRQNLWLSTVYNLIAVPIAVLGYVTPLIAAVAMSGSSVIVTLNAMRARSAGRGVHAGTGAISAPAAAHARSQATSMITPAPAVTSSEAAS
jgi:Cu2+-exporting ATPase